MAPIESTSKPSDPDDYASRHRRLVAALTILATLLVVVLGLWIQGRLLTCACGEVYIWSGDINSQHNSQHLFDPYSFTHLLHGVILAWIVGGLAYRLWPAWQLTLAVILESGWELFENSTVVIQRYRENTISLGYFGDTILNSIGDILVCGAGFAVARYLGWRRSIVLFVLTELFLLVWIRDSLLLNVLMLLYPIEVVRAWQAGG